MATSTLPMTSQLPAQRAPRSVQHIARMSSRGSFDAGSDFHSVLHTPTAAAAAAPAASAGATQRPHLSEQQLYDRIEEQLEQLDKKRLQLQQLLRSYHETPYSSRIARSVESTRIDCARMAKKVHNLFKFVNPIATGGSTQPSPSNDATILKFAPLFQTYASISRILNATCMESIAFEEQLAKKGSVVGGPGGPHRRSPPGSSASSARRRNAGGSSSNITPGVYDPMSDETTLDDDSTSSMSESQQSMMSASNETLPLLTVDGMEAYEAEKKQGDFMNLQSMVLDIAQSFHTLQQITMQQQEQLDQAESNVVNAREKTLAAELEIRKASRYKAFGLVLAGGATGAAIGGPLGALVGLKTGLSIGVGIGLMGAGGALIGAAAGKQIQKARFVPLTHGAEEAELVEREKKNEARTEEIKASESTATTAPSSVVPSPAQGRKSCSALRKCL